LTGCRFASARFFIAGIDVNSFLAMTRSKIFLPELRAEKFFWFFMRRTRLAGKCVGGLQMPESKKPTGEGGLSA